ncbi:hypothetical protein OSB04_017649 [Centaurea solstitialis]|uniref:Dirigent protein n=1 Tax=Centaurea solstitialis TaxID=347529 RepID=A0AA38T3A1_9ASTR|nr:hypothetical protein OSB04_017649 [Centaurea solstitialis]
MNLNLEVNNHSTSKPKPLAIIISPLISPSIYAFKNSEQKPLGISMEMPNPPSNLTSLACFFLLLFTTINQSLSARTIATPPSPPPISRHHKTMTFYMPNVLNSKPQHRPTTPPTTKANGQPIPFSKPLGLFPPVGGIQVPDSDSISSQSFGLSGVGSGITISDSTILQEELEFGMVNTIDVDLLERTNLYGLITLGKAKGMYVASLENGSSQMMAMTTSFAENEFRDELRFFGVHGTDVNSESHVAIIGGAGKYDGANGYATIKVVKLSSKIVKEDEESDVFLLIDWKADVALMWQLKPLGSSGSTADGLKTLGNI